MGFNLRSQGRGKKAQETEPFDYKHVYQRMQQWLVGYEAKSNERVTGSEILW